MSYSLGTIKDFPDNQATAIEVAGKSLLVCRQGKQISCLEDICPHDWQPLGTCPIVDGKITCPRHGAEFTACNGEVCKLPAMEDIPQYKIKVCGLEVEVDLADEY